MKLYLRTFGCRANQYDSEAVREMALASGAELVADPALADMAVFNSCAVTAEAEADLRQQVRRAARANPALRSVIMGCASALPERDGAFALRTLPTVQATIAGADLPALAAALELAPAAGARTSRQTGARALLRIQDGCDEHCTFCATTIARGANRSRPADSLVEEARALAQWHPEIVLTGVHIGSYGLDGGTTLGHLVTRLVRAVPTVRFRLSSIEATEVDDRLAELLTAAPRQVAPYLHAPLQSGSDRLLRRMGRHWYTARDYARAIERLVAGRAVFGLGADVITGFPGESDEDHAATRALVESLPFTSLHVFPYSPRPGAAALRLDGQVAPALAGARAAELRELAARGASRYAASRSGGRADVVVVRGGGGGGRGRWGGTLVGGGEAREGLTEDYLSVTLASAAPRGARFDAVLAGDSGPLRAEPLDDPS